MAYTPTETDDFISCVFSRRSAVELRREVQPDRAVVSPRRRSIGRSPRNFTWDPAWERTPEQAAVPRGFLKPCVFSASVPLLPLCRALH